MCTKKAPINILLETDSCSLKCDYNFNYSITDFVVNYKDNVIIKFSNVDKQNFEQIEYNGNNYNLEEIRICNNSFHTYNNQNADGEIIMTHKNSFGNTLYVCIPIIISDSTDEKSEYFVKILNELFVNAVNNPNETSIIKSININKIIPMTKYYTYTSSNILKNCNNNDINTDYIIFHKNVSAIKIKKNIYDKFIKPLSKTNVKIYKENNAPKLFMNKNGPKRGTTINEDIYIECNPTGDEGEKMVELDNTMDKIVSNLLEDNTPLNIILAVIIGCIVMYLLIYVLNKFICFVNPYGKPSLNSNVK